MELKSLLLHSAGLFKIVAKSYKPADSLAREYFSQNKYIGSNDRKFISEAVFTSLRIYLLSNYCVNHLNFTDNLHFSIDNNRAAQLKNELFFIFSSVFIVINDKKLRNHFNPEEILKHLNKSSSVSFEERLTTSMSEIMEVDSVVVKGWMQDIKDSFSGLSASIKEIKEKINLSDDDFQVLQNRFSINQWILKSWFDSGMKVKGIISLSESLLYPAPVRLRVATNLISLEEVINVMKETGIEASSGKISPSAVVLSKRQPINNLEIFKRGLVEIQDEGSQLISFAVSPEEDDSIMDACAGAGGKSLHLAVLQNDRGSILATDIEFNRLKEIKYRAGRFGFKSINTLLLKNGKIPKELIERFDAVLVDAPCSGLGTARRLPMPKFRLTPELISKLAKNQLNILNTYSKCLRKGGVLVYSTCSLMPQENQEVITRFLKDNTDFEPESLEKIFKQHDIKLKNLKKNDFFYTLYPSIYGTDGFFFARLRKAH